MHHRYRLPLLTTLFAGALLTGGLLVGGCTTEEGTDAMAVASEQLLPAVFSRTNVNRDSQENLEACTDGANCAKSAYCAKRKGDCDGRGFCRPKPTICPKVLNPVCGCDGVTYDNECTASSVGVSVLYQGRCLPEANRCQSKFDCARSEYCEKEPGDCDGSGHCEARPQECNRLHDPVCGCDGITYSNACVANHHGATTNYRGECAPVGEPCRDNGQCARSEWCAKEAKECDGVGVCKPKPQACTLQYDPVCGCNGQTYGNSCEANANGANVDYRGECEPEPVLCIQNGECNRDEYCAKRAGDCDGDGVCEPIPQICTRQYDPVCGCDGQTYGNSCEANVNGANVDYRGECEPEPVRCDNNGQCNRSEYCAKGAGECGGAGVCTMRPEICTREYAPVCGCDGETYGNGCEAARHGANVDYRGECLPLTMPCRTKYDCARSEYCNKEPGDCNAIGECEARPQACIMVYEPVCGCDGRTFGNACEANAHGESVAYRGECIPVPHPCRDSSQCNRNEYCAKDAGDCGGSGICEPHPQICTREHAPVCGCNGQTYSNSCVANYHGTNVDYRGECRLETQRCVSKYDCARSEYCAKTPGDCSMVGICEPRPQMCLTIYNPVCGCDGQTYSNDCVAYSQGASLDYSGECRLGTWQREASK